MSQPNQISLAMNSMLRKETEYRQGIEENRVLVNSMAPRLARGGGFEKLLGEDAVAKYRGSLKEIAEENIKNERQLKAYTNSIEALRNPGSSVEDFQQTLETTLQQELEKIERNAVEIVQEASYVEVCTQLGEQENEDDDFAVLPTDNNASNLKCPLTMVLFEDPVTSKVCKHTFSRQAIMQHLRFSSLCPVSGCSNQSLIIAELETNELVAMNVRRAKKRQQIEKNSQSQSAIDMDDEEEEAVF
mmetsp:Transcript_4103/g.6466  ORF Transcript_4103/g.6466 Transcript_4103/m.6466 type:complete len:245 (+) Transcript_4103:70-804(+)